MIFVAEFPVNMVGIKDEPVARFDEIDD